MSLYIVSIPIGHPDDITLRALKTLEEADFLICEELKNGRKLLKQLKIQKELFCLNEHNEQTDVDSFIQLLLKGKTGALFSDCGTPLFADPGAYLVKRCNELGIKVIPIPGASSLLAALVMIGDPLKQFHYAGFLPRDSADRRKELKRLSGFNCPVVIYDTPYRLKALLLDIKAELPSNRELSIAFSITQPDEKYIEGTIVEVIKSFGESYPKKEFVLVLKPKISLKKSKKHVKKPDKWRRRRTKKR